MTKHGSVKDSGGYFVIDPVSRKVIVPQSHKSIGTVGDHHSEQITFKCPKIIEGHDVSQCSSKYVTWINVYGEYSNDELELVQGVQGTEGMIYLTCTIRNALTVAKGIIQFSVHFEDKDENGTTLYRWSTASCRDCEILDSINAVFGTYEAVYVSNDTLVFDDYTPVADETLALNSAPQVPKISVSEQGEVTAEANGVKSTEQLSNKHNVNLEPYNIKKDVNIFGVVGTYELATGDFATITENKKSYSVVGKDTVYVDIPVSMAVDIENGEVTANAGGVTATVELRDGELYDRDFRAENIKKGVKIYGITGEYDPVGDRSAVVPIIPYIADWNVTYTKYDTDLYGDLRLVIDTDHVKGERSTGYVPERELYSLKDTIMYFTRPNPMAGSASADFEVTGGQILYQSHDDIVIRIDSDKFEISLYP